MPNDVPTSYLSQTYTDGSGERSTMSINVLQLADYSTYQGAVTALQTAIAGVTNGQLYQRVSSLIQVVNNANGPVGSFREAKLLLTMEDTVTKRLYTTTLPCYDKTKVTPPAGTDKIDLTAGPGAALKTAIDDFAASPAGNGVTLLSAKVVGRNV